MPALSTKVDGLRLDNPFVVASGPPGTNLNVIRKAFAEGWGAVVAKTVCLDAASIRNVSPRYGQLAASNGEIYAWENIELISDRPFATWLEEFRAAKEQRPEGVLIASVMEECRRDAWHEIVERCQDTGVDGLELNLSCPHGLPERKMGSAMGEDPEIVEEVVGWVMEVARVPVWAKLTPNVTHIEPAARAALHAGATGLSAINTIRSVIGVNLDTLRPLPTVEGRSTPGGYSGPAVKPIALRMVMELGQVIRHEFPGRTLHGVGGIESGDNAAEFILCGADTVQVCTGIMKHGYGLVRRMKEQLLAFMDRHGFETPDEFKGRSLPYFTSHSDLADRQQKRKDARKRAAHGDADWSADAFVEQSQSLAG
ncbi:MAG: NAD-dependent dihydropyrimidine dehydrogenase subunit PreA [Verrucomicrobiota bacterium]